MSQGDILDKKKIDTTYLDQLRSDVDGLSGLDRTLVDPLLVEADALRAFVERLRTEVEERGPMVEEEVGGANNRHIVRRENPALTAYSKAIGRLGDLMKKISSFAKNATAPTEEDDFDVFNS